MAGLDVLVPSGWTILPGVLAMGGGGGGVNIDFDRSVLIQMVLFLALIVVLKPLVFDPVLRVFEERERRTDGARAEARKMEEKAGALLREYEHALERVHRIASEERERLRTETAQLEARILEEGRVATHRMLGEGRRRIDTEVNAMRFELGKQSERIATQIAVRVLGRELH